MGEQLTFLSAPPPRWSPGLFLPLEVSQTRASLLEASGSEQLSKLRQHLQGASQASVLLLPPSPRVALYSPFPATQNPLSQDALGHSPCSALTHCAPPHRESQLHPILVLTWLAHRRFLNDRSIPRPWNFCLLLIPFGFVGRGEGSRGQASSLGATGKRWIMCLFFNSMKKPTSEIPFLFFLDLDVQLLSLIELGATGSWVIGKPHRHPFLPLHAR